MGGFAIPILLCYTILSTSIPSSTPTDTITPTQTTGVTDTVVSAGGNTELGFFTPSGKPNHWYLGIWYKKIFTRTVVWVANREIPLTDSLGILQLTQAGNLQLVNSSGSIIWSSNVSRTVQNPVAQLLDTGNLVVREENDTNPENFSWESFDFPTDNLLAGMKLGRNLKSGLDQYLTSWRSTDDPAPGNFTYRLDPSGYPELILRSGDAVRFRSGPWNGLRFSGFIMLVPNPVYTFGFVFNQEEVYYYFELVNVSVVSRLALNPSGLIQRFIWVDRTRGWVLYSSAQTDNCDTYALCGTYGSCNINRSPPCWCLNGFKPKFPQDWDKADWSHGCVRRVQLDCLGDGFVRYSGVKLPDTKGSWFNVTMSLEECQRVCLEKCNCTAYTSLDIRGGGSGCLLWFGDLIDIREYHENGQDLYIRMAASELDTNAGSTAKKQEKVIIAASVVTAGMLLLGLPLILWICKRKQRLKGKGNETEANTKKVVGTHGYISPEYAVRGVYSMKSDVFSFGVLVLEILSGKRNRSFNHPDHDLNLLGHAWKLYIEGRPLELVDALVRESWFASEVLRSIHVGLLCVQQRREDRPSMSTVVVMLGGEGALPRPKRPAFFTETSPLEADSLQSKNAAFSADTLSSSKSLRDGETLVSPGQKFELGFFSPGSSKNRYLGIWYVRTPDTVVWVANRNNPIIDVQGVLAISSDGGLILRNGTQSIIWSSNSTRVSAEEITPIAQLLDSGNLVLIERTKTYSVLWQSFDSMCDTRLPGMKLGANNNTGLDQHMTSWKAADDPSPGDFTYRIENNGLPQLVITMGSTKKYRSGPWNGLRFSGHYAGNNPVFKPVMEFNNTELISFYDPFNSVITRSTLSPSGYLQRYVLNEKSGSWDLMFTAPNDLCDSYGQCGPNGICRTSKAPLCECLKGFSPKSQLEWEMLNWSKGCVRSVPLECQKGEGFVKVARVKLPDLLDQFQLNTTMSLRECKEKCLRDCSCIAYANSNVSGRGNGCLMWFGNLIDTREFVPQDDSEQDIYIRLPEYAIDGKFSVKSDVFSLGVLLLEIVSGKRNRGFNHPDHHHSLLGHAWLLWNEDKSLELMDTCLKDSCVESEVQRCIQVGLLCIQKLPEDRPAMSTVVFMLGNEGGVLPMPKEPERIRVEDDGEQDDAGPRDNPEPNPDLFLLSSGSKEDDEAEQTGGERCRHEDGNEV
ncbi:hypothetical protein RHSIM_RhsimUnG0255500 [Rhododendron simsii]|uniref:Receptor-like serine/threonine-protein kinase n=1 Tax=Rhododendron simsii TaxID=118357 RepID=A0A834FT75_RHOSS|nr:hypothetical protein RHSIM_RhsimUnG0255500 [Rhododendron simsii]